MCNNCVGCDNCPEPDCTDCPLQGDCGLDEPAEEK